MTKMLDRWLLGEGANFTHCCSLIPSIDSKLMQSVLLYVNNKWR